MNPRPMTGPLGETICVRGESFVVSGPSGDIQRGGDHGVYVRDTRFLDRLELLVDGQVPRPLSATNTGSSSATFHAHVPVPGAGADPTLVVDRRRLVDGCLHEEIHLRNHGRTDLEVEVGLRLGSDLAYIFDVRHDRTIDPLPPQDRDDGLAFIRADGVDRVTVTMEPPPDRWDDGTVFVTCRLAAGQRTRVCLEVAATDVYGTVRPPRRCSAPAAPAATAAPAPRASWSVQCSDHRFTRLVDRSVEDLQALRMVDPDAPEDAFCAAGSPWYLTLFGRDSLWAAWMALPFDLALADGTLRTLARRQGTRHDVGTEEAPGKILHEIRRGSLTHRGDLPPNYYGTIDATPLFVMLAHEAWRWGLDEDRLRPLLPHVEAALQWMQSDGDPDGDGFLEYHKLQTRGLDNQGWKDSHDGVQFADGTLASPPIALAEVQAYAHDAARRGAELLRHFRRPGASGWDRWADELAERFRAAFWIEDHHGRYPAIALDAGKRPVDGPASNMGHLLASSLVDDAEAALIGAQLGHTRLASGWGLRTLADDSAGFNPLGYHTGSVWPHDTAIAVWGLALRQQTDVATGLLRGLVQAAPGFSSRLPELFGGFARDEAPAPVPYPTACRPQAWAAAGALLLLRTCLGLHADLPRGRVRLDPLWPPPFRSLEVRDLPVGDGRLTVRVDREHGVDAELTDGALALDLTDVGR
jgi:glycogen debranching enzyme